MELVALDTRDETRHRAQLSELIRLIDLSEAPSDKAYFDCITEETVAGLRERVAILDERIAAYVG